MASKTSRSASSGSTRRPERRAPRRPPAPPAATRDGRCCRSPTDTCPVDHRRDRARRGSTGGITRLPTVTATVPRTEIRAGVAGLADVGRDDRSLRRFLHGLPPVDEAGLELRSAELARRRVAGSAELQALDLAVSMVDLTTLEGADTAGRVRALCAQARRPDPCEPGGPAGRGRVRLPGSRRRRRRGAARHARPDRRGGHGLPVGPGVAAGEAGRHRSRPRRGRHRDRHGDRPRRVAQRPLRPGVRRDRRRPRVHRRPRAPEGHPGDRRAARLRRRAPGCVAGAAGRGGRREDLHGQDLPRRDAARGAGAAAGRPRLAPAHRRAARRQGRRRDPPRPGRRPAPRGGAARSRARSG